jgi:hypothetical protein
MMLYHVSFSFLLFTITSDNPNIVGQTANLFTNANRNPALGIDIFPRAIETPVLVPDLDLACSDEMPTLENVNQLRVQIVGFGHGIVIEHSQQCASRASLHQFASIRVDCCLSDLRPLGLNSGGQIGPRWITGIKY